MKKLVALFSFLSLTAFGQSDFSGQSTYHSSTAREIVKMQQAGIEPPVIRSYIQSTSVPYKATPDDIIYLHEQKIADDLVADWIKRGAELSAPAPQQSQPAPQPVQVESNVLPFPQNQQPAANPPVVYQQQPQVIQAPPTVVQTTPTYVYSQPPVVYADVNPWWYVPPLYFGFGYRHSFYGPHFGYGSHFGYGPRFYGHVGYGGPAFHGSVGFGHHGGGFHHR